MNIILTKKQFENMIQINEDYGIPHEYEDIEDSYVTIVSPHGELELGKIRGSLVSKLKSLVSSMNLLDDTKLFIKIT